MSSPVMPEVHLSDWAQLLRERLPLYGHRNWIVIADAAYPAQARAGIETVAADASQIEVVEEVLSTLASSAHVKPVIYTDQELAFVSEQDAPGVEAYRRELTARLNGASANVLPHEQIIAKLDKAAEMFRVLIIKTTMVIPYTSVFFQLDCAYWNDDAEARLRKAMKQ